MRSSVRDSTLDSERVFTKFWYWRIFMNFAKNDWKRYAKTYMSFCWRRRRNPPNVHTVYWSENCGEPTLYIRMTHTFLSSAFYTKFYGFRQQDQERYVYLSERVHTEQFPAIPNLT
jgi:hypothetical protein